MKTFLQCLPVPLILIVVSIVIYVVMSHATSKIFNSGAEAYRAGVPAVANPYGYHLGSVWLDGWIKAKQESECAN